MMKTIIVYIFVSVTNIYLVIPAEIGNRNVPNLDYAGPMLSNHNNYFLPNIPMKPENEEIKDRLTNFVLYNKPSDSNPRVLISPIVKSIDYVREKFPETLRNFVPGTNGAIHNGYYGQKMPNLMTNNNGDRTQLVGLSIPSNLPSPFINLNQGYNLGQVRKNNINSSYKSKPAKRRSRTRKKQRSKTRKSNNKKKHVKSKIKRKQGKQKSARKNTKLDIRHKKNKTSKKGKKKQKGKGARKSNLQPKKKTPVKKDGGEITDDDGDNIMDLITDPRTVKLLSHQYNLLAQLMRRQQGPLEKNLDVTYPDESNDDFKNLIKEVEKGLSNNEKFYEGNPFEGPKLTKPTTVAVDYTPINIMAIGKKSIMKSIKMDPYIKRVMSIYNKKRKDYVKRVKEKKKKRAERPKTGN